jgi:hypothetical protein
LTEQAVRTKKVTNMPIHHRIGKDRNRCNWFDISDVCNVCGVCGVYD